MQVHIQIHLCLQSLTDSKAEDIYILLNEKELSGFPGNSLFGLNPNMN